MSAFISAFMSVANPAQTNLLNFFKNYLSSYQETTLEALKTPEISALLKAQALIGLEYTAATLLINFLNPLAPNFFWLLSWHPWLKFQLRTLSLVIFGSSYLSPYQEDGELIPRPNTERIPLKHLIILNITQPSLFKILIGFISLLRIIASFLITLNSRDNAFFMLASFSLTALSKGFLLWQYSFTRDGYTPEQTVKILSHHTLKNIALGLAQALLEFGLTQLLPSAPAEAAAACFYLFFITHAMKKSVAAEKFKISETMSSSPSLLHPLWGTWVLNLKIIDLLLQLPDCLTNRCQSRKNKAPNLDTGKNIGLLIKSFRSSLFYTAYLPGLIHFLIFIDTAFLYIQKLIQPLFKPLINYLPTHLNYFLESIFPIPFLFSLIPESLVFISQDLSKTLHEIHTGIQAYSNSIALTQTLMTNRFFSPFIRHASLFTLGNTWTQIIEAIGFAATLSDIQSGLNTVIKNLPKHPRYSYSPIDSLIEKARQKVGTSSIPKQFQEPSGSTSSHKHSEKTTAALREAIQSSIFPQSSSSAAPSHPEAIKIKLNPAYQPRPYAFLPEDSSRNMTQTQKPKIDPEALKKSIQDAISTSSF